MWSNSKQLSNYLLHRSHFHLWSKTNLLKDRRLKTRKYGRVCSTSSCWWCNSRLVSSKQGRRQRTNQSCKWSNRLKRNFSNLRFKRDSYHKIQTLGLSTRSQSVLHRQERFNRQRKSHITHVRAQSLVFLSKFLTSQRSTILSLKKHQIIQVEWPQDKQAVLVHQ